jgi:hypothetical protein
MNINALNYYRQQRRAVLIKCLCIWLAQVAISMLLPSEVILSIAPEIYPRISIYVRLYMVILCTVMTMGIFYPLLLKVEVDDYNPRNEERIKSALRNFAQKSSNPSNDNNS